MPCGQEKTVVRCVCQPRWQDFCKASCEGQPVLSLWAKAWVPSSMNYRNEMGKNAYYTLLNEWNPESAATSILKLSKSIIDGQPCKIDSGPCSPASNMKVIIDS